MTKASGYIVKLRKQRRKLFKQELMIEGWFAEPVDDFYYSRKLPLICFIANLRGQITHISLGKRGTRAGTGLRRLNLINIVKLDDPVSPDRLLELVSKRTVKKIRQKLVEGGLLPPKSFEEFVDAFIEISPSSSKQLERYSKVRRERIKRLSRKERSALGMQKESVATALAIAKFDRDDLQDWTLKSDESPVSFLDGLDVARMREDPMVVNDLMLVPGYEFIRSMTYGAAVFENEDSHLTVILANRQPLEELTGTDLIYYNETFGAFIMVQYKAMEKESKETVFRLPNKQLTEEIDRMDKILYELDKCMRDKSRKDFRLNYNPFFLKFCPRINFNPDDMGLVNGMYLPLDYWKRTCDDPALKGKRGGMRLTYSNVGRYMDNSAFIHIVSNAWVGTSITASSVLEKAIRDTIGSGKAVMLAIKRDDKDAPDDGGETIMNPLTGGGFIDEYLDVENPESTAIAQLR